MLIRLLHWPFRLVKGNNRISTEATRDGAPPIDLINGETLCDKLKELKLGVDTKLTEIVDIKKDWFNGL